MPELPEVESSRRIVEHFCCGNVIEEVNIYEQGGGPRNNQFDDIIFESKEDMCLYNGEDIKLINDSKSYKNIEDIYKGHLLKKKLISIIRKGKQLWFQFENKHPISILFHFGMTGSFVIKGQKIPSYKSFKIDNQWPPKFCKLLLKFSNNIELCYCDPRRFGRIKLRYEPLLKKPIRDLALDPLLDIIPHASIIKTQMKSYSAPIKSILLDQEKLFCGIGNYLADEICYQSNIHPNTKANMINELGIAKLVITMKSILSIAVESCANYNLFPNHWLFHYRWDKNKSKNDIIKLPNGNQVIFEEISGRTTAIVPKEQSKLNQYVVYQNTNTTSNSNTTIKTTASTTTATASTNNDIRDINTTTIINKKRKNEIQNMKSIDKQVNKKIKIKKDIISNIDKGIDNKRITRSSKKK